MTDVHHEVAMELLSERRRQIGEEGWTLEHDDEHKHGEIAEAASHYASNGQQPVPWSWAANKAAKSRREQLIIAGALVIAEIERLDRAAGKEV